VDVRGRRKTAVYHISDAPKALSDDIKVRQRRYAITMGIRAVVFIVAAVAPLPILYRMLLIIGSLVLPYVAVVVANGGRGSTDAPDSRYTAPGPRALPGPSTQLGATRQSFSGQDDDDDTGPADSEHQFGTANAPADDAETRGEHTIHTGG
jgi:hypothetical protein